MILAENRFPLFRIMLSQILREQRLPVATAMRRARR